MEGEQGEARTRSRRHDGKDPWSVSLAPAPFDGPIAAGDLVALNFNRLSVDHQGREELLWVAVVSMAGDTIDGVLDNQPTWIRGLSDGDGVTFERAHIIRVMRRPTET